MTMHLAFLCVLQQLVVAPHPAEVGQEVVVRLEATAGGEAGIPITVALPAGSKGATCFPPSWTAFGSSRRCRSSLPDNAGHMPLSACRSGSP